MVMTVEQELTDVEFWDEYWSHFKLPISVDLSFSFDRCLAKVLKEQLIACSGGTVLEIGCAPGKWLAFLSNELELKPNGIEYSNKGVVSTERNFELLGLSYGRIILGNFLSLRPECSFDVVISLGFIEHFTNVDEIIEKHLEWLKQGGYLVLGVPNFRGINFLIQAALDISIIEKHNLDIMELNYYRGVAERNRLSIKYLNYLGSFEPALFIPRSRYILPLHFFIRGCLWWARLIRRARWWDEVNGKLFSSYILAVFQKERLP